MNSPKSVVVGIDYSENSKNALREAARIANSSGGRLLCLHVFDEEIFDAFRASEGFDEDAVRRVARENLEKFVADTLGAGHQITCQIAVGHPFKEVLDAVAAAEADLLVLGSHGLEAKSPRRAGALASRCVRKAPVDVLLIRERQHDPFRCIVACIDFSENSIRAARLAAGIAVQDKASLELLHIYLSPVYDAPNAGLLGPVLPPINTIEIKQVLQGKLEALADDISREAGGLEIHSRLEEWSTTAAGLERRLEELSADLAVLGTRGRTGLRGLLLGTTAEKIIHNSPCSTLAVKPEGFSYSVG